MFLCLHYIPAKGKVKPTLDNKKRLLKYSRRLKIVTVYREYNCLIASAARARPRLSQCFSFFPVI